MVNTSDNQEYIYAPIGTRFTDAKIEMEGKRICIAYEFEKDELNIDINSPEFINLFPRVFVSKMKRNPSFLDYETYTWRQKQFKKTLIKALDRNIDDFRVAKYLPFVEGDEEIIVFDHGNIPTSGKSGDFWNEKFSKLIPCKKSRLGNHLEYVLFVGYVLYSLIYEENWKPDDAWRVICDDSGQIANYKDSKDAIGDIEPTGSRRVFEFYDLANLARIIKTFQIGDSFIRDYKYMIASGSYADEGTEYPIASCNPLMDINAKPDFATGFFVCDV